LRRQFKVSLPSRGYEYECAGFVEREDDIKRVLDLNPEYLLAFNQGAHGIVHRIPQRPNLGIAQGIQQGRQRPADRAADELDQSPSRQASTRAAGSKPHAARLPDCRLISGVGKPVVVTAAAMH
jgi:hypothetical protein